jgi:hypothetical protein
MTEEPITGAGVTTWLVAGSRLVGGWRVLVELNP